MTDPQVSTVGGGLREEFPAPDLATHPREQERAVMATLSDLARATTRNGAVWRTCTGCGTLAALSPDIDRCSSCRPSTLPVGPAFVMRPLGVCPRSGGEHVWVLDGDSADLVVYGKPDHGVSLDLGRCRACGIALLSVGPLGAEWADQPARFELAGARLDCEVGT